MKVSSVMSRKVAKVSPRTTLLTVGRMLDKRKISCVIVTHEDRILGIISERDMVRHLASSKGEFQKLAAGKAMSAPVETLYSDTSLERAVALMTEKKYRRFPIINRIKRHLIDAGAIGSIMSGSGPSVFGIFPTFDLAREAQQYMISQYVGEVFIAKNWEGRRGSF